MFVTLIVLNIRTT